MGGNTASTMTSGGCRCGRYRFRTAATPLQVSYCHCEDCRRATGAPLTVFVGFVEGEVELLGEAADLWRSTPTVERLFCGRCGTPLGYRDGTLPNEIHYYLGALEEPSRFPPRLHAWEAERLGWLRIDDRLPRHARFSRARDRERGDPCA